MTCIVVGLDGSASAGHALTQAKRLARLIGDCELVLVFVIEWTPYSFHTPEELAQRHQRREGEIDQAREHLLIPAAKAAVSEGFTVSTEVRHGDPALLLSAIAAERGAEQIVIGRTGHTNLRERLFGSVPNKLLAAAKLPVTIVP